MHTQPDVYLELALRALERVPRFLAERTLKVYLNDEFCQAAVERQAVQLWLGVWCESWRLHIGELLGVAASSAGVAGRSHECTM
jgi:hypothetical protein